jgi:hypothetical protein
VVLDQEPAQGFEKWRGIPELDGIKVGFTTGPKANQRRAREARREMGGRGKEEGGLPCAAAGACPWRGRSGSSRRRRGRSRNALDFRGEEGGRERERGGRI